MNCSEFRNLFSDHVDGALSAANAARCRAHLAVCTECRRLEVAYRTGVRALRRLDPPSPTRDLSVRILHRARREPRIATLTGAAGLAGALLLASLVAVLVQDMQGPPTADAPDITVADTGAGTSQPAAGGLDLVTVELHDTPPYGLPVTPYVVVPTAGSESSMPFRFEVPAVWSGR
jgi:predicted anti-sigma-YlaC factor YlaD